MKIIVKTLLACFISMPIVGSPFAHVKQVVAHYPIATVGLSCLAASLGLYAQGTYYTKAHKEEVKQIKETHKKLIDSRKDLVADINKRINNTEIIPNEFAEQRKYTDKEHKELKEFIETYNKALVGFNNSKESTEALKEFTQFDESRKNITEFFIKTDKLDNPEITRYQNAQQRIKWSLYLSTATLVGMIGAAVAKFKYPVGVRAAATFCAKHPGLFH